MAKFYLICCFLMAALFIVSASVQLNDPDWYLWIPLYACAAYVHLKGCWVSLPPNNNKSIRNISKIALWLAVFLFSKAILEDYFGNLAGIWSLDMRERVVREKIGSGLVIFSLILQLAAIDPKKKKKNMEVGSQIKYGMAILVGISYGLSLVFLVCYENEMKLS